MTCAHIHDSHRDPGAHGEDEQLRWLAKQQHAHATNNRTGKQTPEPELNVAHCAEEGTKSESAPQARRNPLEKNVDRGFQRGRLTVELSCGPATPTRREKHCTRGLTESGAQRAARLLQRVVRWPEYLRRVRTQDIQLM